MGTVQSDDKLGFLKIRVESGANKWYKLCGSWTNEARKKKHDDDVQNYVESQRKTKFSSDLNIRV